MQRLLWTSPPRNSSQDFYGGWGTAVNLFEPEANSGVRGNVFPVQFRNINAGMFSGPKPSYQRYSASPAASDALAPINRTGV